ncbi:MAG: sulfide/dihydroorotate dehydrogenase-like FAD/NAD-binding protein [candidate division Zixibacteria bacterium]|nr:sulfide/dihydroorotate dehydrogenase-like FAD/NAD-binding protein [candidate division Zixibacteria bacterium]
MPKIIDNKQIGHMTWKMLVEVPRLVSKAKAGQFVILRVNEHGERVPMSIAGLDRDKGLLTIVYQVVGKTSALMTTVEAGGEISDCVGPLGMPTPVENWGTACVVGGGIGIAPIHLIAKAYKEAGNKVITIIGARTKDLLFYEKEHKEVSDKLIVCTDDGSYGHHGFVTDPLKKLLDDGVSIGMIMTVGPVPMMKFLSNMTRPYNVPTWVSLNPLMIDGTGMCGGCRVQIGDETKFACVDGPDFDGHLVDFDLLTSRLEAYREQEHKSMKRFLGDPGCKLAESVKKFKYPEEQAGTK